MVELLGAVIEPVEIALAQGVHGGKQPKAGMRLDHPLLIEQGKAALTLQNPLDDEHHVGASGIVLVKHHGHGPLQRPGQDAFLELGHLLAILQHDAVLAHQIQAADMTVQIHAHAGPVQPRRHLLDMRGFARAVQALNDDAPVVREARQDGLRHLRIQAVGLVNGGNMLARLGKSRHAHVRVDAKYIAHADGAGGLQQAQVSHHRLPVERRR